MNLIAADVTLIDLLIDENAVATVASDPLSCTFAAISRCQYWHQCGWAPASLGEQHLSSPDHTMS
jgi:hypothetical protein